MSEQVAPGDEREAIAEAERIAREEIPDEAQGGVLPYRVGFVHGAKWADARRLSPLTQEALEEAVRVSLDDALLCGRVWEAWQYNTMTEDDFSMAAEDPEFVAQIVNAVAPLLSVSPPAEVEYRRVRPDGRPRRPVVTFETMPVLDAGWTAEYRELGPWLPVTPGDGKGGHDEGCADFYMEYGAPENGVCHVCGEEVVSPVRGE